MRKYEYDIGIIGGGAAGLTAAAGAARFGAKTVLIEKTGRLGGDCLHSGCVPSKTLIRTAAIWSHARRTAEFGLPELNCPPVDLGKVMDRVQSVIDVIQGHDSPDRFCSLGAAVRFGQPSFTDDHTVDIDGDRLNAKSWIIATGSRALIPALKGIESVPYWTNETVFFQKKLPGRLIILGGGSIGLEMAQAFQRLGSRVSIIEYTEQILGQEDQDIASVMQSRLSAEGVEIHTLTQVQQVSYENGVVHLTVGPVSGEGETRVMEGDALLLAAGRRPNVEDLGLYAAGVNYSPKGITTNDRMKTNVPHIYACGDVNGIMPFTHVAGYEAGIALSNAVLHLPMKADYRKCGWCTYTDPEVASIGLNEKRAQKERTEYRIIEETFRVNDRALAEGEARGHIKILVTPRGRFLGAQIVGPHAGELIHEWILAISAGVNLSTIAGMVHLYPTLSEISKKAAGDLMATRIFSNKTRTLLRLLFDLKGRACE